MRVKRPEVIVNHFRYHERGLLISIRERIRKAENDLQKFDQETQITPFQSKLKDTIDRYEKEIIRGKREKFARDKKDYDNNHVYKWNHKGNKRRFRHNRNTSHAYQTPSEPPSSNTSDQESSQDEDQRATNKKRGPRHRDWSPSYKRDRPARGKKNTTGNLQIVNLSSYQLNQTEIDILQKGLSFSPMHVLDKFELTKDVYLFCRQLTFKLLYHQPTLMDALPENDRRVLRDLMDLQDENEISSGRKPFPTRAPSQNTPNFRLFPAIQIFYDRVMSDIKNLKLDKNQMENLSSGERVAIRGLRNNKEFLIKEADKGGNIVIWPIQQYITEAKRQLNNREFYVPLPSDPTQVFKNKIDRTLLAALTRGIINKKEHRFLTVEDPRTPTFYMLPKIHKSLREPPAHGH
ncbi:uncharacterized protein [Engystomops pustulosus]|uniref:uncharacterized protein n=1 Tax=Engystomops pustulosus TaxID=76066 RepID=UPI003AFAA91E